MYVQHEMIRLNFATKHEMLQVGQKLVDNQVVVIKNQKDFEEFGMQLLDI